MCGIKLTTENGRGTFMRDTIWSVALIAHIKRQ